MKGIQICSDCYHLSFLPARPAGGKGGEPMKTQNLILVIFAALIVGAGILFFVNKNGNSPSIKQAVQTNTDATKKTESVATTQVSDDEFAKRFIAYSDENVAKATKNGRAVVFFHAGWCPLCAEAETDLKANWDKVPTDVTILKTDYDTSKELKTKYGIVSQDTWVQIDSQGNSIVKWNSGGKGLATLLANLK